jgi:hypothetical protein
MKYIDYYWIVSDTLDSVKEELQKAKVRWYAVFTEDGKLHLLTRTRLMPRFNGSYKRRIERLHSYFTQTLKNTKLTFLDEHGVLLQYDEAARKKLSDIMVLKRQKKMTEFTN